MPDLVAFFLNGNSSDIEFETLEIIDASFSETFRIVRNSRLGLTATLETGTTVFFKYLPLRTTKASTGDDLDQSFTFTVGDLGMLIPNEIDRKRLADTMSIKPKVVYRTYKASDLSYPLRGPFNLEMQEVPSTDEGSAFEARPPTINNARTGEIYSLARFKALRGLL